MLKTTFSQKVGLLFFGLFLAAVFLELGLRLAEQGYLATQNYRNNQGLLLSKGNKGRIYTILCLGESTTAFGGQDSYPSQLEKLLDQKSGQKFVVINKGIPATTTDEIVANLKGYLDEYRPDIVAAMIGVNDAPNTSAYQGLAGAQRHRGGVELKVAKLFRMLAAHLQQRQKEMRADSANKKILKAAQQEIAENLHPYRAYLRLAEYYENAADLQQAEAQYIKALRLPDVPGIFKLALMSGLAQCYSQQKKYGQAEAIYRHLIKNITGRTDDQVLFHDLLAELYMEEGKFSEAIDTFTSRAALKPTGIAMYMKIAYAYRKLQRLDELEKVLRIGLAVHSPDTEHYLFLSSELGYCLIEHKKYREAQGVFRDLVGMNLQQREESRIDIRYGLELAEQGIRGETVNLDREASSFEQPSVLPATAANYSLIRDIVIRRGLKLVVIQYPMRPLEPLRKLLGDDPGIFYVDNEGVFKKAVAKSEYAKYFVDHFGGDFGHCTASGNALLAEQVAAVIAEVIR